ncbi:MFS transporter [Paractinoplanes toevensis]|uniref:MFS transporter n=1 Tax=Paractinoplanes toevensis TaxID=571911 RepID=A0A919W3N9_9ACTN|nr:MFS transporter [Actinoplanes toevensis]GIM90725.1 MFS transporter [Actinoplanes toevensis]
MKPGRLVLWLACVCQFVVILDVAIVNVALPSVQRDLGFSATGLTWVVNGYVLAFAGFMLLGGRAADLYGHRRILVAGLALFSAASLAAGLAAGPEWLVGARVAQGLGGAMLAPATLAVLNSRFTGAARARAFGAWSAAGGLGGMAGAVAGGVLTTGLSWRWIFLINVPIGVVLMVGARTALTGARPGAREPLDLAGALTGTAGLAMLIYGVIQRAAGPVVAGLLLLAAFVVVEKWFAARPLVPLRLFANRGLVAGNGLLVLFGGITVAMWFFTSLFMQEVLGYTALAAGLGQTPAAVTFVLVARFAAGARPLVSPGCAALVAGFGWLAAAGPHSTYLAGLLGPTLLVASGIGLVFPTLMVAATAGVPAADAGIAGGLANTASQAGAAVALAVLTVAGDQVFLIAAGLGVAIAAAARLLPRRGAEGTPSTVLNAIANLAGSGAQTGCAGREGCQPSPEGDARDTHG